MTTAPLRFDAVWVHCTPLLISKGPMLCAVLPRQSCQCSVDGSHDHLVDAFWVQQNGVSPVPAEAVAS